MLVIKYDEILLDENVEAIRRIVEGGGVVVYPTDTLYGFGGNFFDPGVTAKIDALKKRKDMPYSVAVSGIPMLEKLVKTIPPVFYKYYEKYLPGKFTFLFHVAEHLKPLVKNSDKIGIRIPDAPGMLKLMERLDVPLLSTSVNRSGRPPLNEPQKIQAEFCGDGTDEGVQLLIDAGLLAPSMGSTILDITETPVKCLRRGDGAEGPIAV